MAKKIYVGNLPYTVGEDELREVFAILLSTDKALKSSGLNGRLVLERMILRLCGEGKSEESMGHGA